MKKKENETEEAGVGGAGEETEEARVRHALLDGLVRFEQMKNRFYAFKFSRHGAMGDIYRGQGRVMAILKMQNKEIEQRELAYLLGMSKQALAMLLCKLEDKGYISRTASADDRRASKVSLTAEGAKIANETPQHGDKRGRGFSALSVGEQKTLTELLAKLTEGFRKVLEENGADTAGCGAGHAGMGFHPGAAWAGHIGSHRRMHRHCCASPDFAILHHCRHGHI
jgi:DNA-binding MarR family transcriptional regulator